MRLHFHLITSSLRKSKSKWRTKDSLMAGRYTLTGDKASSGERKGVKSEVNELIRSLIIALEMLNSFTGSELQAELHTTEKVAVINAVHDKAMTIIRVKKVMEYSVSKPDNTRAAVEMSIKLWVHLQTLK